MKNITKILIPIVALGLGSCKTIEEGVIYKTEEYVGKVQSFKPLERRWYDPEKTFVVTDSTSFFIQGEPKIPIGSWAYVATRKKQGDARKHLYFTWKGTKKEYSIKKR